MKIEWKEKKVSLGNSIIIGALLAVVGGVIGANWQTMTGWFQPYMGLGVEAASVDWSSLNEVYSRLAGTFIKEISPSEMVEGAKKGMVESLGDKYTVYLDASEGEDFYDDLHGNVGSGVGIEMGLRDGYVRVLRTLPDNPARAAGILAGDIIYKVNGEEVWTLSTDEVGKRVRGETGSEVTITVIRGEEEKEYTMKRDTINNVSEYVEYDGDTAIVTVTRFDENTGSEIQKEAKEFASKGVKKVILDLRNNGGGYVSAAVDLLGLWLDGEKVLIQKSLHQDDATSSTARGNAILSDMKTVVLVNGSTASASEIVAGALQDYEKAKIVGETTYGKGVVQNLFTMSNGGLLKVTTAAWYTPKDRTINEVGITPDIVVERTYDDINKMRDPQMDKAKEL